MYTLLDRVRDIRRPQLGFGRYCGPGPRGTGIVKFRGKRPMIVGLRFLRLAYIKHSTEIKRKAALVGLSVDQYIAAIKS
jgi:hypothetical protein